MTTTPVHPDFPALAAQLSTHAATLTDPGDLSPSWRARIARDIQGVAAQLRDIQDRTPTQAAPAAPRTADHHHQDHRDIAALWARSFQETLSPNALDRLLGELGGDQDRAIRAIQQVAAALASGKTQRPRSLLSYVIVAARNLTTAPARTAVPSAPQAAQPTGPIQYPVGMTVIHDGEDGPEVITPQAPTTPATGWMVGYPQGMVIIRDED